MCKESTQKLVFFTDLDGTLLDHASYRWGAAGPALDKLIRYRLPLVIVTSKTRAEVLPVLRALGRREPFVVENGGAIYLPSDYFPFHIERAAHVGGGWLRVGLGTPYRRLVSALAVAARRARVRVRGFAQMRAREVAERTGLGITAARRALQREYDEPFLVLDGDPRAWARLRAGIQRHGLRATRGSRFFHILGANDKGVAVGRLTVWYHRALGPLAHTVGLGDSPNDIALLRTVDQPILVARPNGRYDAETFAAVPSSVRAGGVGPAGWNRAVLRLLGEQSARSRRQREEVMSCA